MENATFQLENRPLESSKSSIFTFPAIFEDGIDTVFIPGLGFNICDSLEDKIYDTARAETPLSQCSEECHCCSVPLVGRFLDATNSSYSIFAAIIFKLVDMQNVSFWQESFQSLLEFLPKTLLLGYVFLNRLSCATDIPTAQDVMDMYFVCCVLACKSQRDNHLSTSNLIEMSEKLEAINLLEGFILNKLDYNVNVCGWEIEDAVTEIEEIGMIEAVRSAMASLIE